MKEVISVGAGLKIPKGEVLFEDSFIEDLRNWYHEGVGTVQIIEPGTMRIDCTGSRQGGPGCQMFCRKDFPDGICIQYKLRVHQSNGLVITFVAMRGLNGEDIITDLPGRTGVFRDYVGQDAKMRSYHVSVSRYNDAGEHTGVSNWRRNPGLHLVGQGPDPCKEIGQEYSITIIKDGPHCQLGVDGKLAHEFTDPGELPDEIPTAGKIGFRAIGSKVIADIRGFRVIKL